MSETDENSQFSKVDKVKKIFLEWSQRMNLNCYTKIFIYRHKPLISLIWLFILLASSGITFWLIVNSILDYFNHSIVSQIGIAYETKSLFPTVTICDNNPFTTLQAQDMYEEVAKNFNILPNDSRIVDYANLIVSDPFYGDMKKQSYGLNLNQIISCTFNGQPCNVTRDFDWIWIYSYGNCWQFNANLSSDSNLKKSYDDIYFGLNLTVSLEIKNKYLYSTNYLNGLLVLIHNNSFSPYYNEKSKAFVETGKKTFIAVKRTFNYKMAYPYSQCVDLNHYSSELYDLIVSNRTYRQSDCFKLCRQKLYIERCGCNIFNDYLNVNPTVRFCKNESDYACFMNIYTYYSREECEKNLCPLECNSVQYDLSLSSLSFTNNNLNVQLVIYYPALEYTIIKESPQTTGLDLFAKIGGTLGVLIGLSVFTLFEIVEILVLVIRALIF